MVKKCQKKCCKNKVSIIGICKWCGNKKYCTLHRLPEDHDCVGIKEKCNDSFRQNEKNNTVLPTPKLEQLTH